MNKYDIYGIGNALVDIEVDATEQTLYMYHVDKGVMTLIDESTHVRLLDSLNGSKHSKTCGGSAANSMITSRQFGAEIFFSCKVGNDASGEEFYQALIKQGVATNLHEKLSPGTTGKCIVFITPDAERSMNTFLGISLEFSENELSEEDLSASKYLYIEGYLVAADLGYQAVISARELAEKYHVKIALSLSDPNIAGVFSQRLYAAIRDRVEILFCNKQEALIFTRTNNLTDAKKKLCQLARTFVITMGGKGAIVYDGKQFTNVPGCPAQVIDTTGAGDIFAGTFLYGITHGLSYVQSARLANFAAAKVVAKYGPRLAANDVDAITNALNFDTDVYARQFAKK